MATIESVNNQQAMNPKRVFLFLQGHPSFFARDLATELGHQGHRSIRINFCAGDMLFSAGSNSVSFRGFFHNWQFFLKELIESEKITDILYYGDRKPYHVVAAQVARELKINAFAYEFGYLRPDWITIERNGMSAFSHFPDDPNLIRQIARKCDVPDVGTLYPYTKTTELFHEVVYNLTTVFTPFLFPLYKADRYYNQILEYVRGIPGLFTENKRHRQTIRFFNKLIKNKIQYFLFPLQLQNDYQLRCNAPFKHQKQAIELAIASFSSHAPTDSLLIFKLHPYDNGWEGWPKITRNLADQYSVSDRIHIIHGGNLEKQIKNSCGCVLINSTVGLHALRALCPIIVLGTAIYDIAGLCHQESLDQFWRSPQSPDASLVEAFVRAVAGTIQVKGNFFNRNARAMAVKSMAQMLINEKINGYGAYVDPAPRLAALEASITKWSHKP